MRRTVAPSSALRPLSARQVAKRLQRLLAEGKRLTVAGSLSKQPVDLLAVGYRPRHLVELFGSQYFLCAVRENEDIRFMVAYVHWTGDPTRVYARLFYKDVSLTWRAASHYSRVDGEHWIGKGAVRHSFRDGLDIIESNEATTDLPLEIQTALETAARSARQIPYDELAIERVLRRAPPSRLAPYADFSRPREAALKQPDLLVNGGKPIAWFANPEKPESLRFARGYRPDFDNGVLERSELSSTLYGGKVARFRIASQNGKAQYSMLKAPRHAWVASAQGTGAALSSFGVRCVDAVVDEDFLLPGYEYHFMEDGELHSQIPAGFAGEASPRDPHRADASAWLNRVPVLREFAKACEEDSFGPPSNGV